MALGTIVFTDASIAAGLVITTVVLAATCTPLARAAKLKRRLKGENLQATGGTRLIMVYAWGVVILFSWIWLQRYVFQDLFDNPLDPQVNNADIASYQNIEHNILDRRLALRCLNGDNADKQIS